MEAIQVHGGDVETNRESHARREYEQAPILANGARPDWAMRAAERQMGPQEIAERARQQDGTTEPLWTAMRDFWAQQSPRPSPAENAKRYSKPDQTW